MELLEIHLSGISGPALRTQSAGRAVRLVGYRKIELRCFVGSLRLGHPTERVVGAEHHAGRAVSAKGGTDLRRVGRDRTLQL